MDLGAELEEEPLAREYIGGPVAEGAGNELRMIFATLPVSVDKYSRSSCTGGDLTVEIISFMDC